MQWSSAVSGHPSLPEALSSCIEAVRPSLDNRRPDLAIIFVSPHHAAESQRLPDLLQKSLRPKFLLGCTAGGVIGGGHEIEERPGLSLTVARMPDVKITPFHVEDGNFPNPDAPPQKWEELVHVSRAWRPEFIVLADPFTLRTEELVSGLDFAFPESSKVGGLASGGSQPGANLLFLGDQVLKQGAIGVALAGNVLVDTVVAQGCRPIGKPMGITKCRGNVLMEVDGRPVTEVLREIHGRLSDPDRELFRHSLSLGLVMDELQEDRRLGDFLIRNLLGPDSTKQGLVVGEMLRDHQTVQFHLRDARTASEDLQEMLAQYVAEHDPSQAQGALLFSCLGRGIHLFGHEDHDTELFREVLGPLPLGGFFCNGEIGQVGGASYLHGSTSSFGIFRPRWGA